jgi:hypothetical protein
VNQNVGLADAFRPVMPPETPDPLKQHVSRREIGNKKISIDVDALLDNLRGNQDTAFRTAAGVFAKRFQSEGFQFVPPPEREFRMK